MLAGVVFYSVWLIPVTSIPPSSLATQNPVPVTPLTVPSMDGCTQYGWFVSLEQSLPSLDMNCQLGRICQILLFPPDPCILVYQFLSEVNPLCSPIGICFLIVSGFSFHGSHSRLNFVPNFLIILFS